MILSSCTFYAINEYENIEKMKNNQITKNQHYIPRFYMKHFSMKINEGRKNEKSLISFFQFKDCKKVDCIPINSVCSSSYFYDDNGIIEDQLASREKNWASAIRKVNNNESLTELEIKHIKEFVVYQVIRTKAHLEYSRKAYASFASIIVENMYNNDIEDKNILTEVAENASRETIKPKDLLRSADEILQVINDLELVVINNDTQMDLFTSDVPVINFNPLCSDRAGLDSIGTVVLFPSSPRKLVMLYDGRFFGEISTIITNETCIQNLNKYQFVCAHERILAKDSQIFDVFYKDEELMNYRRNLSEPISKCSHESGDVIVFNSRNIDYLFDIPLLRLPKALRKIPSELRETFPRKYEQKSRCAILQRLYCQPANDVEVIVKENIEQRRKYANKLLDYFDYYWNTPKEDRTVTSKQIDQYKKATVQWFPIDSNE